MNEEMFQAALGVLSLKGWQLAMADMHATALGASGASDGEYDRARAEVTRITRTVAAMIREIGRERDREDMDAAMHAFVTAFSNSLRSGSKG